METKSLEKELVKTKEMTIEIRNRRREIMYRLSAAGFTQLQIAKIYGSSQVYVSSEIAEYKKDNGLS